ncbi:transmembrane protein 176 [Xenentodon cancila]
MAVSISRDLTVQVLEDVNAAKLMERQRALQAAIQRGEPKSLGVSQVMLGLMVLSYSIPLHLTEFTAVVNLGVPWWSSAMFITAGVAAIILDRRCTMKTLLVCLVVTIVSAVLSVVAIIIYSVDIHMNPETSCIKTEHDSCDAKHYTLKMSKEIKSTLLLFTLVQTAISAVICFLLSRQRFNFRQYTSLSEPSLHTPTGVTDPDLN